MSFMLAHEIWATEWPTIYYYNQLNPVFRNITNWMLMNKSILGIKLKEIIFFFTLSQLFYHMGHETRTYGNRSSIITLFLAFVSTCSFVSRWLHWGSSPQQWAPSDAGKPNTTRVYMSALATFDSRHGIFVFNIETKDWLGQKHCSKANVSYI